MNLLQTAIWWGIWWVIVFLRNTAIEFTGVVVRADSNGRPFAPELSEPPLSLPAVTWVFNNLGRLLSLS